MSTTPAPQAPKPEPAKDGSTSAKPAKAKPSKTDSLGRGIRTVIYVTIAVITTIFLLANSQRVEVNYVLGTAETPLFVALGLAVILGALLTLGAVGIWKVRHRN